MPVQAQVQVQKPALGSRLVRGQAWFLEPGPERAPGPQQAQVLLQERALEQALSLIHI